MSDDASKGPRQFRLVWRWKETGTMGTGPWTQRSHVVEGWFESLSRRSGDRVEHWIETGPIVESEEEERRMF
jgi:hypothetical protein